MADTPFEDAPLHAIGEFELLDRIRDLLSEDDIQRSGRQVEVPSGDDAAVWQPTPGCSLAFTIDTQVVGRHFRSEWTSARALGHRAMTVSLSDLAAMGARPAFTLVSGGLTREQPVRDVLDLHRGMLDALRGRASCLRSQSDGHLHADADLERGVILGGNLARVDREWFLEIAAAGEIEVGRAVRRSGAKPGDRIFVSGVPGRSAAGLRLLDSGRIPSIPLDGSAGLPSSEMVVTRLQNAPEAERRAALAYLAPRSRLSLGSRLALSRQVTSMIDVSDGLLADLGHICRASGVGARLQAARFPSSTDRVLLALEPTLGCPALNWSFVASDDYELAFTLGVGTPPALVAQLQSDLGVALTEIGEIVEGDGVEVEGVAPGTLPKGFDHFLYTAQ